MKVFLPLSGFSWYGLKVVDLTGLSSSCLSNSGCLGLFGLTLTEAVYHLVEVGEEAW